MKHSLIKLTSLLITAVLLFSVMAAAPFAVSADDNTFTIKATSNLFEGSQIEITEWTSYENKEKEAYVSVEYTIRATDKYLIGLELDELTWDPTVLEYKESYNKVKSGNGEVLNLFPFAVEQGCGTGTYNTFGDYNGGRIVGNYSKVFEPAEASGENNTAAVAVKAIFKVLNKNAGSTTVNCSVETLSLCDKANAHPYVQYLPVNRRAVNTSAANWAEYGSSAAPIYPKPYLRGKSLTIGDGDVDVNFFLYIKEPNYDTSRLRATFEWGEGEYHTEKESTNLIEDYKGKYYVCNVGAPCMNDKITFTLYEDNIKLFDAEYSVTDYVLFIKNNANYSQRRPLVQLLCDMLDYGGTTQLLFNYHTDALASDFISELNTPQTALGGNWERVITTEDLPNTTNIKGFNDDNAPYGMKYSGATISVDAKMSVKMIFDVTASNVFTNTHTFVDGTEVPLVLYSANSNTRYCLEISNVKPDHIFDAHTITIVNGENSVQKIYSAANYFNSTKNNPDRPQELKDVVQAINNYANSTAEYVNQQ